MMIRFVRRADRVRWLPLWESYHQGTASDEVTEATWERLLAPEEPVHALVAETEGRLVGLAHFIFHRDTAALGPACFLQDLFTSPDARGRGVGRRLIEAVCAEAEAAGSTQVHWRTHVTNTRAMALYDRLAERAGVSYRRALPLSPGGRADRGGG